MSRPKKSQDVHALKERSLVHDALDQAAELPDDELPQPEGVPALQGTVTHRIQGVYRVETPMGVRTCTISSRLRKQLVYPIADPGSLRHRVVAVQDIRTIDPVAIGDVVRMIPAEDGVGQIVEVLPRKNKLSRLAAGPKPIEQVIVANVDQVVFFCSLAQPATPWNLIDRYLAAAEASNLDAIICATKADLARDQDYEAELAAYRAMGYAVFVTSVETGQGVAAVRERLANRLSVLVGVSGAGKTSLLNAIQPELGLRVGAVSESTGKGKHTTTHLELFALDGGGGVVDAPGMREFGLWELKGEDLLHAFRDLRPYSGKCRFGLSCRHRAEPGCAVVSALRDGQIHKRRYESFLKLAE